MDDLDLEALQRRTLRIVVASQVCGGAGLAAGVTVGLSEDMHKGIIDRFRSLPMASSGVLIGRSLADLLRTVLVLVVLSISGLLVGWSIDSSVPEALAGYGEIVRG